MDILESFLILNGEDIQELKLMEWILRGLRFGVRTSKGRMFDKRKSLHSDGVYISAKMWKERQNRINTLLGVSRRYEIKEFHTQRGEDVLDRRETVRGIPIDRGRIYED